MSPASVSALFWGSMALRTGLFLYVSWRQAGCVRRHRNEVPAAFSGQVSRESHRRAAAYTVAKVQLGVARTLVGTGLLAAWSVGGGLAAIDAWSTRLFLHAPIGAGCLLLAIYLIAAQTVGATGDAVHTFVLEARFGFNRIPWATFVCDRGKGLFLSLGVALCSWAVVLALLERAGARWYLWAWASYGAFSLAFGWLYPRLVAPWLNAFRPLQDADLVGKLEALAQASGFRAEGIYVMEGSSSSAHGNAYLTGLGRNKRIVFFDTLLQQLDHQQVVAVLAHELGHFRLGHVPRLLAARYGLSLLLFFLAAQALASPYLPLLARAEALSPAASLLLLAHLTAPLATFVTPLLAWWSRHNEYAADAYAAARGHAVPLRGALMRLAEGSATTLTPDRLHVALFASYPPTVARLAALDLWGNTPVVAR